MFDYYKLRERFYYLIDVMRQTSQLVCLLAEMHNTILMTPLTLSVEHIQVCSLKAG